jgi:sugar phosphate isomerase/epimerase
MMDRREFVMSSLAFSAAASTGAMAGKRAASPRFAHRQAQMITEPGQSVFDLAARIPGLSGVQLQMIWKGTDISEGSRAAELRREAHDKGLLVPSIAGIWKSGENILKTDLAEQAIGNAIRAASTLGAQVILIVMFKANCPDMTDAKSYEPVVALLRRISAPAKDAGVKLCLETSLTPADDRKLLEVVDRSNVRSYYDATNTETFHPGEGLLGIKLLGPLIAECHLKNENRRLDQAPSKVDWAAAIRAYRDIDYNHWFCFETEHTTPQAVIDDTRSNIAFVRSQFTFRT